MAMSLERPAPGNALLQRVLEIVAEIAGPNRTPPDPGTSTRLWGGGFWLDSIDLLDLMSACDAAFGPVFQRAPRSVMPDIKTVGDLVAVIEVRPQG
jgi:acyl carrier protein